MKLSAKSAALLLPLVLTGCFHWPHKAKTQPVAPPVQPTATIGTEPVDLPPAATTIPPRPTETAKTPNQTAPKPPPPRRKAPPKQQPQPEETASAPSAPPAVSAIGQLSSGDPADYRRDTEDSILSIEKGLNGLNRSLSDTEQKTADHIREFLKQARQALGSGDVDGAHNLAAKAKVLLAELQK